MSHLNNPKRYKDDKLLEKTDNIQIESKGKGLNLLVIKSVTLENVGTYKIKARNESDQIECTFTLVVDGLYIYFKNTY